jgi:hypothetical protein
LFSIKFVFETFEVIVNFETNLKVLLNLEMVDRVALRQVLKSVLTLSENLDKNSLPEIRNLISKVSTSMLEINLPKAKSTTVIQDVYCADVYENNQISCSVFGIQLKGGRIPLHGKDFNLEFFKFDFSDHCNCFGFIRVLRGSLKVKSYSLLDSQKERELVLGLMSNSGDCSTSARPVIYEGNINSC